MFTLENTNGYTQRELDEMNQKVRDELIRREIDPDDTDLDDANYAVKRRIEDEVFNSTF